MRFIKQISKINDYQIDVVFDNDELKTIDVSSFLNLSTVSKESIYFKLKEKSYFESVKLDSYGTLSWNNEIDFCPDVLYEICV